MGWTEPIFASVDWEAFGKYSKRLPVQKRIKMIKFVHYWQNVGTQKMKIAKSEYTRKLQSCETEEQKMEVQKDYAQIRKCPMECGHDEETLHFLV